MQNPKKDCILIVDDDPGIVSILKEQIHQAGYEVLAATTGHEAVDLAKKHLPNLILLDVTMPGMDGLEVKKRLNQDESTEEIPVIFLTANATTEDKVKGLQLKPDDYVTKPFEPSELLARIHSVMSRRKRYEHIAMTDALTGLGNQHVFKIKIRWLFEMAKRYGRIFSVVVIDINEFKSINDTWGHSMGDLALKQFGETLSRTLRAVDIPLRYGGDEFVILLPESNEKEAYRAMDRLRDEVQATPLTSPDGKKMTLSFSLGIATYQNDLGSASELFEKADKEMYLNKKR